MSNLPPPPPGGGAPPPPGGGGFPPPPGGTPPGGGGFGPPPGGPPPGGGFPPPPGPGGYPGGGPPGVPGPLAEFQDRVVSGLIDYAGPWLLGYLLSTVGGGFTTFGVASDTNALYWLGTLLQLLTIPWALFNGYQAGQTGQSIGMKQSGLRLVGEQTGQPIGGSQGLVRNLLLIPGFCCCGLLLLIDGLFPLWDAKKQTLRDKIGKSVVVKAA